MKQSVEIAAQSVETADHDRLCGIERAFHAWLCRRGGGIVATGVLSLRMVGLGSVCDASFVRVFVRHLAVRHPAVRRVAVRHPAVRRPVVRRFAVRRY